MILWKDQTEASARLPSIQKQTMNSPNHRDYEHVLTPIADAPEDGFESDMEDFTDGTEEHSSYEGTYDRDDIYYDHN